MKKSITIALLCMLAISGVQAQISESGHWYNGSIVFSALNQANGRVTMNAMDEGEEHEFILMPVAGEPNTYKVVDGPNGCMNMYRGNTVSHVQEDGLDVLCFYDKNAHLLNVMTNETEWNAEKLNKDRWLSQMIGDYNGIIDTEVERLEWRPDVINTEQIEITYDIETFNGRVTDYINVGGRIAGTFEVVPTLQGVELYQVYWTSDEHYSPFEREREGAYYVLTKTGGRFDYASTTLLNDKQFRELKKSTLRIMRNYILARHGYAFTSPDLQQYFASQPWYKPRATNDGIDDELSLIERLNILLIQAEEADPEHDEFVKE